MRTKNMNYFFNVEYFENVKNFQTMDNAAKTRDFESKNKSIFDFKFTNREATYQTLQKAKTFLEFSLYTTYPGLLMGTGYPHDMAVEGAIKCGFSFDYVTGLPYLPGASLKGILRSAFAHEEYIRGVMGTSEKFEMEALIENIFEGGDTFLDVFPVCNGEKLMGSEYITPHNKGKFKNPIPIQLVKVLPGVEFRFCFLLQDYVEDGEIRVSAARKKELFQKLLLDFGIGAKTNVGFGRLSKTRQVKAKAEAENVCRKNTNYGSMRAGNSEKKRNY